MASGFQTAPSRFQIQQFDAELVAVELDGYGRGLDDLAEADSLLSDISGDVSRLRREKLALVGERADATQTLIDAGQAFLDGAAVRLREKAKAGDAEALRRLLRAARNIRATLRGEHPIDDAIANVGKTAADIAADTRAAAGAAASLTPWIVGLVIVGALAFAWTQRAALRAAF